MTVSTLRSLHGKTWQGVGMEPLFDFPIHVPSKSNSLPTPLQNSLFSLFFVHVLPPLQTPSNSPHHLLLPYSPLPKIHVIGLFSSRFLSTPAPFQLFPPKILRKFFLALPPTKKPCIGLFLSRFSPLPVPFQISPLKLPLLPTPCCSSAFYLSCFLPRPVQICTLELVQ